MEEYFKHNYTLYNNPGFRLVNNRCILRVFSYLELISFIFTTAGVFARVFHFFTLACLKPPNSFGIPIKKITKIKIPQKVYSKLIPS